MKVFAEQVKSANAGKNVGRGVPLRVVRVSNLVGRG